MSESTNPEKAVEQPVTKKRSWIERLLVWGGILVLLSIVLTEWTSRRNYELTLDELDTAIRINSSDNPGEPLLIADVERYIRGLPIRSQYKHGAKRYLTFQWPSLFRFYKMIVLIDARGIARTVDAFTTSPGTLVPQ